MSVVSKATIYLRNPRLLGLKLHRLGQRYVLGRDGVNIMDEDWDNLIILDACRYDLFADHHTLSGELKPVISKGSHTSEFLRRNFNGETYADTVYVSATPQVQNHVSPGTFHALRRLWEDCWDEQLSTVPPEAVVDEAIETHRRHPEKRLIIHFMQPHYPFIGEQGRRLQDTPRSSPFGTEKEVYRSIWDRLEAGEVTKEQVQGAYRENFELVLPHVAMIIDEVNGKTIVTSDHGNSFGRFGVYGHPPKLYFEDLVLVPWLEIESKERRIITEGRVSTDHGVGDIEKHLRALGYK